MVFGWVKKLKKGLSNSSSKISEGINSIIKGKKIDGNRFIPEAFKKKSSLSIVNKVNKISYELNLGFGAKK